MAESDTADSSKNVIKVEEEIEGEQIGTRNYRFSKIGESVPIKSDADFKFDMESLPARPLAVSELFGAIFVAHSSGFCVARTKDVMKTAEELKNGGNGSCIQELSIVDVSLGKVSILALSADSSMLAATVDSNLFFFSVEGLLNKDQEPSFSKSINDSNSIKDMQWSPRLKNQYIVLTNDGNLYHASGQNDLNSLMDNVDAVNWNMDGKYLAVAKSDDLIILSSKLEEKLQIKLLFDSLVDDSDSDSVVKVDSIKWARPDCIILGCYRLNGDGKEENYLLQLITVKDGKITNSSSNPVALTFSDAFLALNEDDIPSGTGPHMFASYLDEYEVAFIANRKNTDQHIVLFGLSSEKNNGAEMIEITNDAWLPTINLQDNSDDNLILGLAVDKVYNNEKLRLTLGEEDTEVSPCCVLMCLTIDAKLFMFHFASATGPSPLSENESSISDEEEEDNSPPITSQHPVINTVNSQKPIQDQTPQKVKVDENDSSISDEEEEDNSPPITSQHPVINTVNSQKPIQDQTPQKVKVDEPIEKPTQEPLFKKEEEKTKPPSISQLPVVNPVKTIPDSVSKIANEKSNKTLFGGSQDSKVTTESSVSKPLFGFPGASESFSSGPLFSSNVFGSHSSSSSPFTGIKGSTESSGSFSSGSLFSSNAFETQSSSSSPFTGIKGSTESSGSFSSGPLFSSNAFGTQSSSSTLSGIKGSTESSVKTGSTNPPVSSGSFSSGPMFSSRTSDSKSPLLPTTSPVTTPFSSTPLKLSFPKMPSGPTPSTNPITQSVGKPLEVRSYDKGSQRSQTQSRTLNSDPTLSEQRSVEEMAKELDTLLESIQAPGGFFDASVAALKPSVASLEEGLYVLSQTCQKWTDTMDQGIEEVQLLLDKTVQVLARKIYMEAIVKQATDSQYLDIWNRQKLSSELDMKRRHILEINQNLTNQLIELERHLNTLELQRYGDKGDMETNRRSLHNTRHGPPKHVQSLHSLHNTMSAQLAAAEKLSECLSKQMTMLSIETGPAKKQNVKKELFDTIGISYDSTTFSSPSQTKAVPPKSQLLVSSSSNTKKSQQGIVKSSEPETARRRRDSLDRSWASIEPPKTTVKRMLLQEEKQTTPVRLSLPPGTRKLDYRSSVGPAVSREMPPGALSMSQSRNSDSQMKRNSERLSNQSILGSTNKGSDSSKVQVPSVVSLGSGPQSTQDVEKSKGRFTFTLKSDPVMVNAPKISQPSPSLLEPSSNTTKAPVTNIFQKKPVEVTESSNKVTEKPKFSVTETSSIWSKKSQESPFSAVSSATSSSTAFTGKSFSLDSSSTKEKQPSEPVPVTSTFVFKDSKPSTGFGAKSDATQTTTIPAPSTFMFNDTKSSTSVETKKSDTTQTTQTPAPSTFVFKDTTSTTLGQASTTFGAKSDASQPTTPPAPAPSPSFPSFSPSVSKPETDAQITPPAPVVPTVATNTPLLNSKPEQQPSIPDVVITQEEDSMEEEAPTPVPDTTLNLGGFGLGSTPNPGPPKQNPFGAPFGNPVGSTPTPVPSFAPPQNSGGLFRPASFSIQSSPPSQPLQQQPQQMSFGFSGGGQGFGQPAQIGAGQQALGSVLGAFGQSRQFGGGQTSGGFATAAAAGGGFASLASGGGGFGGFGSQGGGSGFSSFGSSGGGTGTGTGVPPASDLFTQMRR